MFMQQLIVLCNKGGAYHSRVVVSPDRENMPYTVKDIIRKSDNNFYFNYKTARLLIQIVCSAFDPVIISKILFV